MGTGLSRFATCASFLRPNQPWDTERTFLEALREKYVHQESTGEAIYFSTKQAEEVGFDKFAQRQAQLRGIHVLVLDHMRIRHPVGSPESEEIARVCSDITDLDVSSNLFERWSELQDLIMLFPKLRSLSLAGNRFDIDASLDSQSFDLIRTLNVSNVLLHWSVDVVPLLRVHFDSVNTLIATNNEWTDLPFRELPASMKTLDVSDNSFETLADLNGIQTSSVETLLLKDCSINSTGGASSPALGFASIMELDIRHNRIADWPLFNALPAIAPKLKHLRTTGNPLYAGLKSAEGKVLSAEDGYMLTIARLPALDTLNYSKITDKERLNAETYYLSQIAAELSATSTEAEADSVRQSHPRWRELCEEYGEPAVLRKSQAPDAIDPSSLAAKLIRVTFVAADAEWTEEVPKSFSIYEVLGLVGKKLGIMPLDLRLMLETDESDMLGPSSDYSGPDWWCSDSEDSDDLDGGAGRKGAPVSLKVRLVELTAGTRAIGTYAEGPQTQIRVEARR